MSWLKLHREAAEHPVFQDADLWHLFCWCMINANVLPSTWRGVELTPGQFVTGRMEASRQLHIPPSTWYRRMEKLAELGCISITPDSKWTVITVNNWATYNGVESKTGQEVDSKRTANGQQTDTDKEDNKYNNSENLRLNENKDCSELPKPEPAEPPILVFPTSGDPREWPLTQAKLLEYQESFPFLDVMSECRKARQWAIDNPRNRKTAKGTPAFLSRWLSKAQDRAPPARQEPDLFGTLRQFQAGGS